MHKNIFRFFLFYITAALFYISVAQAENLCERLTRESFSKIIQNGGKSAFSGSTSQGGSGFPC